MFVALLPTMPATVPEIWLSTDTETPDELTDAAAPDEETAATPASPAAAALPSDTAVVPTSEAAAAESAEDADTPTSLAEAAEVPDEADTPLEEAEAEAGPAEAAAPLSPADAALWLSSEGAGDGADASRPSALASGTVVPTEPTVVSVSQCVTPFATGWHTVIFC